MILLLVKALTMRLILLLKNHKKGRMPQIQGGKMQMKMQLHHQMQMQLVMLNIKQETSNKKQEATDLINNQFEQFWKSYIPVETKDGYVKKGSKDKAEKSFGKALKKASFEKIMKALEDYLLYCSNNNRFTKNAVTWLNDADFDIEETAVIISKSGTKEQKGNAMEAYKNLSEKYKNEERNEDLN